MKITKKLKYAEFEYDEETKEFLIVDPQNGNTIELNKVYAFAFMRFVIRMAQRNWLRQVKKSNKKLDIAPLPDVSSDQMEFPQSDSLDKLTDDEIIETFIDTANEPF